MLTCFGDDVFDGNVCVEVLSFDKKNRCAGLSALPEDSISGEGTLRGEAGIAMGLSALFPSDVTED